MHSVNYALRFPYFVDREQVGRLVKLTQNVNQEKMEADKKRGGAPVSAFKDFFLKDDHSFSLELLYEMQFAEKGLAGKAIKDWV